MYMWQSRVEIEHRSVTYLITLPHLKCCSAELSLKVELMCCVEQLTCLHGACPFAPVLLYSTFYLKLLLLSNYGERLLPVGEKKLHEACVTSAFDDKILFLFRLL